LVVGESRTFPGVVDWLRSVGVKVVDLDSTECATMLAQYCSPFLEVWNEDIGEE
jgi:cytosine/creatinine deaminase